MILPLLELPNHSPPCGENQSLRGGAGQKVARGPAESFCLPAPSQVFEKKSFLKGKMFWILLFLNNGKSLPLSHHLELKNKRYLFENVKNSICSTSESHVQCWAALSLVTFPGLKIGHSVCPSALY